VNIEDIDHIENWLRAQFDVVELGRLKLYLGFVLHFDEVRTWMHVHHYIEELLQKLNMVKCFVLHISMNLGQLWRKDMYFPFIDQKLYW
jgi:hypothetical protein